MPVAAGRDRPKSNDKATVGCVSRQMAVASQRQRQFARRRLRGAGETDAMALRVRNAPLRC
jgi:hypothetical protein